MKKFTATKVSGGESSLFAGSVLPFVVQECQKRIKLKAPFYGLSFNLENSTWEEWIRQDEYIAGSKQIINHINAHGLNKFQKIKEDCIAECSDFAKLSHKITLQSTSASDEELDNIYQRFIDKYIFYYALGAITFVYESALSEELTSSLSKRYEHAGDLAMRLLQNDYRSFMLESEILLAKIKYSQGGDKTRLIDEFLHKFFFIKANYRFAPVLNATMVSEMAVHAHQTQPKKPVPKIDLTQDEKNIIDLLKITEAIRDQRKMINQIGNYTLFRFLEEMEKRTCIPHEIPSKPPFANSVVCSQKIPSF